MAKSKKQSKRASGAVATAWKVFSKNPKAERKEQLEAAVKAGVNLNTAKTQYQLWLHASPKQRAEKVDGNGSKQKEEK
jgi:hypothetical protein